MDKMDDMLSSPRAKAILWLLPFIFGAGGVYASLQRTGVELAKVEQVVDTNEKRLNGHLASGFGHDGARERVIKIETNQQQIIVRQQRAAENIAAICQATGASCR